MDEFEPVTGDVARKKLRQVLEAVDGAVDVFETMVLKVADLDTEMTDAQVAKPIVRLREAFHMLTRERQKYEDAVDGKSGAGGFEPLDIDAARDEVGRLLDRLRRAGASGSVSEQPEP